MRKIFILTLIFINTFNLAFAQELVLSDRIREAREAAKKQEIKEKVNNIKPVNIKEEEILHKQIEDKSISQNNNTERLHFHN